MKKIPNLDFEHILFGNESITDDYKAEILSDIMTTDQNE